MKTIIIVGAGASAELGLPVGSVLKQQISNRLMRAQDNTPVRDPVLYQAAHSFLYQGVLRHQKLFRAANLISEALPLATSIDNFLDAHRDDQDIQLMGKLAIVRSILEAEQNSPLHRENGRPAIDFEKLSATWYVKFFRLLVENCTVEDLPERFTQVRLVVFNYDRCIERFLVLALIQYFDVSGEVAADLLSKIEIVHPYGVVGSFDLRRPDTVTPFGYIPNSEQALVLAEQILTFSENVSKTSLELPVRAEDIWTARRVVFLGFAYHDLNLRLLFPDKIFENTHAGMKSIEYLGTAYGVSASDVKSLETYVRSRFRTDSEIWFTPKKCTDFFDEHQRRLSFVT